MVLAVALAVSPMFGTLSVWSLALIVAVLGMSAVVNLWLTQHPRLAVALALVGLAVVFGAQLVRTPRAHVQKAVYIECGSWYCWPF